MEGFYTVILLVCQHCTAVSHPADAKCLSEIRHSKLVLVLGSVVVLFHNLHFKDNGFYFYYNCDGFF